MSQKQIRILHYIGCLELGGSQSMMMNIYRNIDRGKIQFDFIVDKEVKSPYIKEINELGGKIYVLKHHYNVINHILYKKQWEDFFNEHSEYKIIHCHVRSVASIVLKIAKKHKIKTISHSHSTSNGKGIKAIIKKILQKNNAKYSDYLMACTKESAEWLYGKKTIKNRKVTIINNAINEKDYEYDAKKRQIARKKLGIEEKIVIGQIGRFEEVKNHIFSIKVLERLIKDNKNYILLMIGSGKLKEKIEKEAEKRNLKDNILILQNRSDVPLLLQAMDVYIMPSLYEGLPMSLVEAQAASLPCIISENIKDGIINKKIVIKIPTNNPEKWAEEIRKISTNHQRNNNNKEIKRAGFSISTNINAITNIYRDISRDSEKIVICIGSLGHGGAERVITNLCNSLIEDKAITIITTRDTKIGYEINEKIKIRSIDGKKYSKNFIFRTIARISKLRKILIEEEPEVLVTFLPEPSFRAIIAKMGLRIPTIVSERNDPNKEYDSKIKKVLANILYNKADGLVFQTEEAKNWFKKSIQDKSIIIPNPLNKELISRKVVEKRNKVIINVGRLVEQKNQKLLIDSFYKTRLANSGYTLKIYGEGPLRDTLQEQIDTLNLNQNVKLAGETNCIFDEISTAKIFVLTSKYEGMPNSLMEAMALGTPCISTDCPIGGPRYLIDNMENGILVNSDSNDISNAILRINNNPSLYKYIKSNSIKIREKLNPVAINQRWEEYINTIANQRRHK